MSDAGEIWYRALSGMGNDIGGSLAQSMAYYHQQHVKYDQAYQFADALSRIGIDPSGQIVKIQPDTNGKTDKNVKPIIAPDALEIFQAKNQQERVRATGALEALGRIGALSAGRAISSAVEDASISGQRTKQLMTQETQAFPLRQEHLKQSTAHLKKVTEDEGKIPVPGFGFMTGPQLSAHNARMQRLEVLKQKAEPLIKFETDLQNSYGVKTADIVQAAQGKFTGGTPEKPQQYTGVPFVDIAGDRVAVKNGKYFGSDEKRIDYNPKNPTVFAQLPNGAHIPAHEWPNIVAKAKSFSGQLDQLQGEQQKLAQQSQAQQAQAVVSLWGKADPNTLNDEQRAALAKAQSILAGQ